MELDPEIYKQLLETFKGELDDELQTLTDELLKLEKEPDEEARTESIQTIFRIAHTIKGASASVGIESVTAIAHRMEDIFSEFRDNGLQPSSNFIDICFDAIDAIRDAMNAFNEDMKDEYDNSGIINKLCSTHDNKSNNTIKKNDNNDSSNNTDNDADTKKSNPRKKSPKNPKDDKSQQLGSSFVKVPLERIKEVTALSDQLQSIKLEIDDLTENLNKLLNNHDDAAEKLYLITSTVKSSLSDKEIHTIHESCSSSLDNINNVRETLTETHRNLHTTNNELGLISDALQSNVQSMRLVPMSLVLRPLTRTVRDLAKEFEKKIDLSIKGDDVEMDRTVLDLARDPIIHLIRNAIDHGIGTPEERKINGKSETGHININVESKGSEIHIIIKDDGKGIDLDNVVAKAIKKQIITQEFSKQMSDEQRLDLIFSPGLSTKDIITDVSGRGVGMDVVRNNIIAAKGNINIQSSPRKGTTVNITLPMTLLTDRSMIVETSKQLFAIPTNAIKRTIECKPSDIISVEAGQAIMLDDEPVPLRELANVLEIPKANQEDANTIYIIVINKGPLAIGFVVDQLIGERECVIKHLGSPLENVRNISGATLTGRGDIIIVLNAAQLLDSALHASSRTVTIQENPEDIEQTSVKILVVDDSITTRTLEVNILKTRGFDVSSAVNGKEAWDMVQNGSFDLIVTDIEMPIMNGFELTEKIKTSEKYKDIPIIIVSSRAEENHKQRGIEVGANAYIVKSQFETQALLDVVEDLL